MNEPSEPEKKKANKNLKTSAFDINKLDLELLISNIHKSKDDPYGENSKPAEYESN